MLHILEESENYGLLKLPLIRTSSEPLQMVVWNQYDIQSYNILVQGSATRELKPFYEHVCSTFSPGQE